MKIKWAVYKILSILLVVMAYDTYLVKGNDYYSGFAHFLYWVCFLKCSSGSGLDFPKCTFHTAGSGYIQITYEVKASPSVTTPPPHASAFLINNKYLWVPTIPLTSCLILTTFAISAIDRPNLFEFLQWVMQISSLPMFHLDASSEICCSNLSS